MIYFIKSKSKNAVKIGFTNNNPRKRLSVLQVGSLDKLSLLKVISGDLKLERAIHLTFHRFRLKGEWFSYSGALKDYIDTYESTSNIITADDYCNQTWNYLISPILEGNVKLHPTTTSPADDNIVIVGAIAGKKLQIYLFSDYMTKYCHDRDILFENNYIISPHSSSRFIWGNSRRVYTITKIKTIEIIKQVQEYNDIFFN